MVWYKAKKLGFLNFLYCGSKRERFTEEQYFIMINKYKMCAMHTTKKEYSSKEKKEETENE